MPKCMICRGPRAPKKACGQCELTIVWCAAGASAVQGGDAERASGGYRGTGDARARESGAWGIRLRSSAQRMTWVSGLIAVGFFAFMMGAVALVMQLGSKDATRNFFLWAGAIVMSGAWFWVVIRRHLESYEVEVTPEWLSLKRPAQRWARVPLRAVKHVDVVSWPIGRRKIEDVEPETMVLAIAPTARDGLGETLRLGPFPETAHGLAMKRLLLRYLRRVGAEPPPSDRCARAALARVLLERPPG